MKISTLIAQAPLIDEVVGEIQAPPGVEKQINKAITSGAITADENALLFFISNMLKIVVILLGVWVIFNIILAGYDFINNKDSAAGRTKARDRLTMSVIGLLLIVAAYTVTGVIGAIFFGDAGFILNPTF